jgi:hypothetical protein
MKPETEPLVAGKWPPSPDGADAERGVCAVSADRRKPGATALDHNT